MCVLYRCGRVFCVVCGCLCIVVLGSMMGNVV